MKKEGIELPTRSWADDIIEQDPLYRRLKKEDGKLTKLYERGVYVVSEFSKDENGGIRVAKVTEYDELPDAIIKRQSEKRSIAEGQVTPNAIYSGESKEVDFGVIRVGLSMYRSSVRFYLTTVFEWDTLPTPSYFTNIDAVVSLSVADQLTIDGDSVHGTYYYTRYSTTTGYDNGASSMAVEASTLNGVGGTFHEVHQRGSGVSYYLTALRGNLSCYAYKSNPNNTVCSGLAQYIDVNRNVALSDFSVSYPLGVSFSISVDPQKYNVQDAMMLNS